jgi:hypothetical protein
MTAVTMSIYGTACIRCGETLVAPRSSHYVSERHTQHRWSCDTCRYEFDTSDHFLRTNPALKPAREGQSLLRLLLVNKTSGGHSIWL